MVNYSEKIKRLRKSKGLSQIEMANTIGISQTAYGKIESGFTKTISIEVGVGIASALNALFTDLFEIEDRDNEIESLKTQIVNLQNSLDQIKFTLKTAKNERSHIKEHLILQMTSNLSFDLSFVSDQLSKATESTEKSFLKNKKKDMIRVYNINKEYYIRTGFFTQKDFEDHINEMGGIYHVEVI